MGTFKTLNLDAVTLQNVSFASEDGYDTVLSHVDFEMPLDQTVLVQSSNPVHSIQFLEILAGHKKPQSGCVKWNEKDIFSQENSDLMPYELMGCYFENQRPHPKKTVTEILTESGLLADRITELLEQFSLSKSAKVKFVELTYEVQKTIQLISVISKSPQLLILEDPALGLSEDVFLEILDLIQYGQRQGQLRHIFMTNHHPTALRHLDVSTMHVEDGLIYFEENIEAKKLFNF
ncbi:MAG: ATP-binding cassette domain-containing protein [Pseudobdellovibrio sp.]